MKVRFFICILCVLLCMFVSCKKADTDKEQHANDTVSNAMDKIEEKLDALIKDQEKMNAENKALFDKLCAEIAKLEKNSVTSEPSDNDVDETDKFLYEIKNGKAIITGYTGKETDIVIPARIDGYFVEGVGENAFSNSKLTSVIISDGVSEIDWFAFYTVPSLVSVTIPSSVVEIGYAAFDGASSSFSIYCHSGSYAYSFAQSYGIPYVII